MDTITRYYLRKSNLSAQDEYHERIALEDVNELQKAGIYMLLAPALTFAVMFGYSKFRTEGGGSSSHFQYVIDRTRSRIDGTTAWPAKKDVSTGKLDFSNLQEGKELNNLYKQLKQEKEEAKKTELEMKQKARQAT